MTDRAVPGRGWLRRWLGGGDRQLGVTEHQPPESQPVLLAIMPPAEVVSTIDGVLMAAGVPPKTPSGIVLIGADSGLSLDGSWEPIVRSVVREHHGGQVRLAAPAFVMQDAIVYLPLQAAWALRLRDDLVRELVTAEAAAALSYEPLPLGILVAAPWSGLTHAQSHRLAQIMRESMTFPVEFAVEAINALSAPHDGRTTTIGSFPLLAEA